MNKNIYDIKHVKHLILNLTFISYFNTIAMVLFILGNIMLHRKSSVLVWFIFLQYYDQVFIKHLIIYNELIQHFTWVYHTVIFTLPRIVKNYIGHSQFYESILRTYF